MLDTSKGKTESTQELVNASIQGLIDALNRDAVRFSPLI